jgi:hypothetical protein
MHVAALKQCVKVNTSATNFHPIRQMQSTRWTGKHFELSPSKREIGRARMCPQGRGEIKRRRMSPVYARRGSFRYYYTLCGVLMKVAEEFVFSGF